MDWKELVEVFPDFICDSYPVKQNENTWLLCINVDKYIAKYNSGKNLDHIYRTREIVYHDVQNLNSYQKLMIIDLIGQNKEISVKAVMRLVGDSERQTPRKNFNDSPMLFENEIDGS